MKYTVVWELGAQDELIEIWLRASDRSAVSNSSDWIDRALRIDPESKGHPLGEHRILVDPPLAASFRVYPDDRMVTVFQVRQVTR